MNILIGKPEGFYLVFEEATISNLRMIPYRISGASEGYSPGSLRYFYPKTYSEDDDYQTTEQISIRMIIDRSVHFSISSRFLSESQNFRHISIQISPI